MRRTKLKSAKLTAVGQKTISSFFSPPKQKESTFSFESETSAAGLDKTEAQKKPSLSSPTFSPTKRNILGVLENILPSSPDLLSIPETPDSQIRPAAAAKSKDQHRSCPQHSGDAPGLGTAGPRSPLCRSPRSRGSAAWRRSESGREKMEDGTFGSVKRLFGHEESHNTKRSRTANIQVTNYVVGPKTKSLEVAKTAQGPSSKNNLSNSHLHSVGSEDNQAMFTDLGRNSTSLKPVAESRLGSSRNSSGVSGQQPKERPQADSVFTVIMEQKTPLQGEVGETTPTPHPRTANTEAQRHDAHTLDTRAVPLQEHPTEGAADRVAEGQTADAPRTSPGRDGLAMTSSDADWLLEDKWFDGEMDQIAGVVREEKPNVTRIPDHVILSGGLNNRYWVLDVEERPSDKILTITCSRTLQPRETCRLKDGWEMSPVSPGDVVHLEGRPDSGSWLVDRDRGFLVLLPDTLISGTSTSGSIRCMRRAVLGEIFKSFDGHSKQMLNGTMVHEVFQKAAMTKDFSMEKLTELARVVLHSPQHLSDMYSLGVTQEEMKQELHDYLPSLGDWANDYLNPSKPRTINLKPSNSRASFRQQESAAAVVTVTELTDIEENIWSPRFGLKGKIDVTARVQIQRPRRDGPRIVQECVVPLELKTGKETNSIEHRSQVILYTLMSMERRGNAEAGLLLYLKTGNLFPVVSAHMDCRELLMLRNTLAHHLGNTIEKRAGKSHLSNLPDMVTDRQTCRYCPQRRNCALYERVMQGSNSGIAQDAVGDFLLQETGHLAVSHLEYFSHWLLLCCLESITMETKNSRRHVWLQSAEEREKSGGCVGNLQISGPVIVHTEGVFLHRFRRSGASSRQEIAGGLAEGDRIVVSDQEGRLVAVATGYMCDVARLSVSCTLDRDLSRFRDVVLRLDQDEGVVGLATHLTNLSRLMDNSPESDRLRELVVEQRLPEFISNLSSVLPREAKDSVANILKGLNKPQKQAMKKVLLSKDYTLIVGMPGTGKTTTICTLVRILHACGFSVLLTSYTHSAVDNILLKLKRFRVGFLRLGRGQKVHPDILPYTETEKRKGVHTLSELEQLYNKELVVATTSMGIKHPIFTRRQFDFCIIDEASQISQPVCLGPLFYAKRFVLVGDHQQLPPIVQNREARSLGMDESLFKRLELHSEAVVHLNVQYRMNRQIMSLSNSLMYDGRLESGSERTASALLSLPFLNSVQSELNSQADANPQHDLGWMHAALQPSNPVCFLDTSLVPALETVEQGGVSNNTEAALTHILLSLLIKAGCNPSDIGVIAPYRQQLKSISALLQSCAFSGVEVNTVDRYQGRDKSVIVLSFVRSTLEEGHLGELLKDWRRLNVAVTRAKHKLLMVGSASTLRCYAPLEKLLSHLQQEDMIVQLPAAAHTAVPSMHL